MQSVGRCLQMMLRVEEYRTVFYQLDGVVTIVQVRPWIRAVAGVAVL